MMRPDGAAAPTWLPEAPTMPLKKSLRGGARTPPQAFEVEARRARSSRCCLPPCHAARSRERRLALSTERRARHAWLPAAGAEPTPQ